MRYDDDYDDDLPRRSPPRGVSSGWRVAAVLGFVLAGLLAVAFLATFVAFLVQERSAPPRDDEAQAAAPFRRPPPAANDDDDDANVDPKTLPYPVAQDLRPPGVVPAVAGEPPPPREPDARDQFLRAGETLWASDEPFGPEVVLVSPDGQTIAYAGEKGVMFGPPRAAHPVQGTRPRGAGALPHGPAGRAGGDPGERPAVSAWSADGIALYWAGADGSVGVIRAGTIDGWAATGLAGVRARCAVPVPPREEQFVLVRHRARPKVDGPDRSPAADPSEVVLFQPAKKNTRVLVPAGTAVWRAPAVSPDGRRLALISDSGHETALPRQWRVFVLDLAGGEPKPLTPPAPRAGSVCWTPDGKALVYDRSAAFPGDDNAFAGDGYRTSLFEADPATGRETRLTPGAGFSSPSVSRAGDLYCLVQTRNDDEDNTELFRVPLRKARELAAAHGAGRRNAKAWAELTAACLREAGLPADAKPAALDEEKVKKLAAAFAKGYRERFRGEPPDTAAELDRLRAEARGLHLPAAERTRLGLLLGAAEGEYLRKKHGARWALGAKPTGPPLADPKAHELFRHVFNPFRAFWPEENDPDPDDELAFGSLALTLGWAEGRPLVLADGSAVHTHVPAADPDLARGVALLGDGKGDEADRVLLEMTKRHAGNYHLALHVGTLLHDRGRKDALRALAKRLDADALKDARVYNLVGVSLLDDDPRAAVAAFRNALRCDLYHGPAYFNLAQAYEKADDVPSARLCLRRYLKLMPYAPLADDARRRLAELPPEPVAQPGRPAPGG